MRLLYTTAAREVLERARRQAVQIEATFFSDAGGSADCGGER
jgi:hypothetical protein